MAKVIVICEARADFQIATELAERVLIEQEDWLESLLTDRLIWNGAEGNSSFSCWADMKHIIKNAKEQGIHLSRYLGGTKGLKADGASAYKVLNLVKKLQENNQSIKAVVLMRDSDNQLERWEGLNQARELFADVQDELDIVIGVAHTKREAWVLNGFEPNNREEASALQAKRQQLGFDPCLEAERLRETSRTMPQRLRNIKVVWEELIGREREEQCWQETSLDTLRERGGQTGLAAYLAEVEERLLPIVMNDQE